MKPVIWLVGASTGIGKSLVAELAVEADTLFISARSADKLSDMASRFANVTALPLDITDAEGRQKAIADIRQQAGRLDWLILNAGTCEYIDMDAEPIDLGMYDRVLNTNFHAPVALFHEAYSLLRTSADARLVGVSSSVTFTPLPKAQAYGASKAAFSYWLGAMATDIRAHGVRVQVVSPGFVDTPLTRQNDFKMPFLIDSDNAARRIVRGLKRKTTHIHFPKRFTFWLQLESLLPMRWQLALNSKLSRVGKED